MKTEILGVNFDNIQFNDALDEVLYLAENGKSAYIVTPNSEICHMCLEDESFKKIINSADLVFPDGIGVIYASKILKKPIQQKITGSDITVNVLSEACKKGLSIYLFGAKPGVSDKAKEEIEKKYPNINIVGTHHGYFDDDTEIINDINDKGPNILLVCLGAPKQEKWMFDNRDKLNINVMLGIGGMLDVLSGDVKRAPIIWQKLNLEWLYRVIKDPKRIKRLYILPKYIFAAIKERMSKNA